MRAVLDTSVLIGEDPPPAGWDVAISAVSLGELHFGVMLARAPEERARRMVRLSAVEAAFDPLPVDARVAREWGALAALVAERGAQPRRRHADLLIAATAKVHDAVLLTSNARDLAQIADLVDVREP